MGFNKWGNSFSQRREGPKQPDLFPSGYAATVLGYKGFTEKALRGVKKKINTVSNVFNFCENDYNLAKNADF